MLQKIISQNIAFAKATEIHLHFDKTLIAHYEKSIGKMPKEMQEMLLIKTINQSNKHEFVSLGWHKVKTKQWFSIISFARKDIERNHYLHANAILNMLELDSSKIITGYFESSEFVIKLKGGIDIAISDSPKSISIFNFPIDTIQTKPALCNTIDLKKF